MRLVRTALIASFAGMMILAHSVIGADTAMTAKVGADVYGDLPIALVQEPAAKPEKFSALAFMPAGMGPRMAAAGATANLDIYFNRYTSDGDAKQYAQVLIESGSTGLLKKLEDADSIGKVTLTGRVGFFDLKLIRSRKIKGGRRIVGVCDRPIQFLEAYSGGRSLDYTFGIVILDLKTKDNGEEEGVGQLIYAAKIKVLKGNKIEVENYGIEPARLQGVRKL